MHALIVTVDGLVMPLPGSVAGAMADSGGTCTCSINDQVSFAGHPGQCPGVYVHSG